MCVAEFPARKSLGVKDFIRKLQISSMKQSKAGTSNANMGFSTLLGYILEKLAVVLSSWNSASTVKKAVVNRYWVF